MDISPDIILALTSRFFDTQDVKERELLDQLLTHWEFSEQLTKEVR